MSIESAEKRRLLSRCAWLLMITLPGSLLAQYYDDPGLDAKPVAAHPQDYKPLGIRAGSFMLHPGVQVAGEYTDNVFYANDDKKDDIVIHVRPYITAQSTWSRHSINLSLAADIARYADFDERDYEDYFLGITGQVDVKSRSFFKYSLDYMDLHEGLNNRSSEQGVKPTRYALYGGAIGYDHTFNRLSLGLNYHYEQIDFDNVARANGDIIDNQDRDRDKNSFRLRAGYQFQTDKQVYVSYTGYTVDFDQPFDRGGYGREGDGYTVDGGVAFTVTGKLNGDLSATYHDRKYDDPRLPGISGWAGGAGLQWKPTQMTSLYGRVTSSIEETTDLNSSGSYSRVYSLRADHELTRFIQISGFVALRTNDYKAIDPTVANTRSKDKVWRTGLGVSWFINRNVYLNASYDYETLDSSVPADDYDANTIWLQLALER